MWKPPNTNQDLPDDFSDLASFDASYRPESPIRAGIDTLSDGDYDFEVRKAELTRTAKTNDRILRIELLAGGRCVEWVHFLSTQSSMNQLGADLCVLGFDADRWGQPGRSVAVELPKAVAQLPGRRFRATKRTDRPTEGQYAGRSFHKLYVNALLSGSAVPPNGASPKTPAPAPPPSQGATPPPPISNIVQKFWTWDAKAREVVQIDANAIQERLQRGEDPRSIPLMELGAEDREWRRASDFGFGTKNAPPF
jgi:hypothetical protein